MGERLTWKVTMEVPSRRIALGIVCSSRHSCSPSYDCSTHVISHMSYVVSLQHPSSPSHTHKEREKSEGREGERRRDRDLGRDLGRDGSLRQPRCDKVHGRETVPAQGARKRDSPCTGERPGKHGRETAHSMCTFHVLSL